MSNSPSSPAPAPSDPDEEPLASGRVPRGPFTPTAGSAIAFKGMERDLSGTQLGEYQLVRKIAVGGMGEVYEGVQLKLDRRVAVKLLSEELSREPELLARFEREAKSAAALNHPNVVQVYDFGCAQGHHYFVMELVDGTDLSVFVKEHGKLAIPDALHYFEQAVNALKFALDHAIIHRDVKPANLMLTSDGVVKVSDLGLAKKLTDDSDVTMTGVGMGSPHFLAPEQADDAAHVDHRADIYALGVTLLYLLTGKRPFEGASNFSVVLAHANKPLPTGIELGTALPDELEDFIKRMTAKRPEGRYQNYDELLADLRSVKAGHSPSVNWLQLVRDPRNLQRLAIVAVAILIIALAVPLFLPDKRPDAAAKAASPTPIPNAPPDDTHLRPRASGGKGNPPQGQPNAPLLPFPPPSAKNFAPMPDGAPNSLLIQADRYAKDRPDDLDGKQLWQVKLGNASNQKNWGSSASPLLYKDTVIITASEEANAIVALDKQTGKEVWRAPGSALSYVFGTPALAGTKVLPELIFSLPEELWALNPDTGKLRWFATSNLPGNIAPSVVVGDGVVFAFGGYPQLGAVAVKTGGKGDVTGTHRLWQTRDSSYVPTPVVHEGRLYVVTDQGFALCLDAKTGEPVFKERLPGASATGRGGKPLYASPVLANGNLYAVSRRNGTFVIEAKPQFKLVAHNALTSDPTQFNATPALSGNDLFLRSDKSLYCIATQ